MSADRKSRFVSRFVFLSLLLLAPALITATLAQEPQPEVACPSCDDRNPCTIDSCDATTGTCRHDPLNCDDNNPCTADQCQIFSPTSGSCFHLAAAGGTSCDDANSCTSGDACVPTPGPSAQCVGQVQPAGTGCDDGNSCTSSDTCSDSGQCAGTPALPGSSCDDQSGCTSQDTCVASPTGSLVCQGTAKDCGDQNLCTEDLCNAANGQCSNPPINCDDGNACTADSCDPASGACLRANQPGSCSFGDQCVTGLSCSGGNCIGGTPVNCDDQIFCTVDGCQSSTGCTHTPVNSRCGFNNACAFWLCLPNQGGCYNSVQQGPGECDGNPCTTDSCIQDSCVVLSANTNPCNDGNPCTINDRCSLTQCRGTPLCDDANPCTGDTCNPSTLACSHVNLTGSCSDGNPCTTGDVCIEGTCQGGTPLNCDDGDPCTVDSCTGSDCAHSMPPMTISVSLSPSLLRPTNHKMVNVTALVTATTSCPALSTVLTSITSSEPDDAAGPSDGHTVNDIQGAELGTADFNFQLRAEADRNGSGRLYTVVYTATDSSGRQVVGSASILAPVKGGGGLVPTPLGGATGRKAKPR
jgi:hypothetical protein